MANDVKVLKLITGEEVLARIEQKDTVLILDNPQKLMLMPQEDGQFGFALLPWILAGKNDKITVPIDQIVAQDEPNSKAENRYLTTVTGLTL